MSTPRTAKRKPQNVTRQKSSNNWTTIPTTAYTLPNSRHNLLCLAYIIYETGAVIFKATGACVVQGDCINISTGAKNMWAKQIDLTYSMKAKFKLLQTRVITALKNGHLTYRKLHHECTYYDSPAKGNYKI